MPQTRSSQKATGTSSAIESLPRDQKPSTGPSQRRRHPSSSNSATEEADDMEFKDLSRKSQWIALALMSGACAAFNGVFAKLTTTTLTTTFATHLATLLHLSTPTAIEVPIRALFFALNLLFNGIMWTLFTKALARGTSTTQVSILNTSANFMLTAVLGWLIFSESLPPLWFVGAGLLVAGNVIIGRREEGEKEDGEREEEGREGGDEEGLLGEEVELGEDGRKDEDEDVIELGDLEGEDDLVDLRSR